MGTSVDGGHSCARKYDDAAAVKASAPVGALLAKVGEDGWVYVGSTGAFVARTSGTLYLTFNDSVRSDNTGGYSVHCHTSN
jgi:hypothetical protein